MLELMVYFHCFSFQFCKVIVILRIERSIGRYILNGNHQYLQEVDGRGIPTAFKTNDRIIAFIHLYVTR